MPDLWAEFRKQSQCQQEPDHSTWRTVEEVEDSTHGIIQVGIARSACFGECPVYDAIVHASGLVEYTGLLYVSRIGDHRAWCRLYEFQRLCQFITNSGFWNMESRYDFRDAAVSDAPGSCVLVATAEQRKLVSNYSDSGPPELWAIAGLIDLLLQGVEWEESSKTASPD